jgi:siroheme synthase-like protein
MARDAAYPVFLNLQRQPALVVGGGGVALRKVKGLLECGARVTVVSPEFLPELIALPVKRVRKPYASTHMEREKWWLVFAATNVTAVNAKVRKDAAAAGILCSRADDPDDSDFAGGAHQRIGISEDSPGMTIAISTTGASPILAARICREVTASVDPTLVSLTQLLAGWREKAKHAIPDPQARRTLLHRAAGEEMEAILRSRGTTAARKTFTQWLAAAKALPPMRSPH